MYWDYKCATTPGSANLKRANLRIIGIEEGIEAETKGINNLFREVILENFPNIEKEVHTRVQEAYRTIDKIREEVPHAT